MCCRFAQFQIFTSLFFHVGELQTHFTSRNFLKAGHGKGPADDIGGAIKQSADASVANEGRITNAKSLMTSISGKTKVEMSGIQESDITIFEKVIPSNLSAVLHQVTSSRIRYVNRNI